MREIVFAKIRSNQSTWAQSHLLGPLSNSRTDRKRKKLKPANEAVHDQFRAQANDSPKCNHCSHKHPEAQCDTLKARSKESAAKSGKKITVEVSVNTLKAICIEMTCFNGIPLSFIEDSEFRKIIDPILGAFPRKLEISVNTVKEWIKSAAELLREEIKKEIKDKYVSIKLDMARRLIGSNHFQC